jgi:hypothetical protein
MINAKSNWINNVFLFVDRWAFFAIFLPLLSPQKEQSMAKCHARG